MAGCGPPSLLPLNDHPRQHSLDILGDDVELDIHDVARLQGSRNSSAGACAESPRRRSSAGRHFGESFGLDAVERDRPLDWRRSARSRPGNSTSSRWSAPPGLTDAEDARRAIDVALDEVPA